MSDDESPSTSNFLPLEAPSGDAARMIELLAQRRGLPLGSEDIERAASFDAFLAREQAAMRGEVLDFLDPTEPATASAWIGRGGRSATVDHSAE